MARLIGPSEASREVKSIVGTAGVTRDLFKAKKFRPATFYVDPDPAAPPTTGMLTALADIRNLDGTTIADSNVTTDAYSMLPLIQFPDGADSLLIQVDGGPPWRVYAREDDRLDALAASVTELQGSVGGAETPAGAQGKVDLHAADTTGVHGIADTALLETQSGAQAKAAAAQSAAAADATAKAGAAQAAAVQRGNHTGVQSISTVTGLQTSLDAKADLVGGVIPTAQIPALAINETFTVVSQAAMLALTAQRGDVAVRTDLTPNRVFILAADAPGTLANWKEITAAGSVTVVNGQSGAVTLAKGDIGLGNVDNTSDAAKPLSSAAVTALAGKADKGASWLSAKGYVTGDGVTEDLAGFNAAVLAAATFGAALFVPNPPVFYKINGSITPASGQTIVGAGQSCEIRQSVWAKPVFDLTNVDSCIIDTFKLVFSGTRPTALSGTTFRGEDLNGFSSGVWSNGNNHRIQNIFVDGLQNAVRLVNWTTGNTFSGYRTGNRLYNIKATRVDFGPLIQGQDNLFMDEIYSNDNVDSSGGVNPLHTIYVTGNNSLKSRNMRIGKAHGDNVSGGIGGGYAHQFKFVDGLTFDALTSNNCPGPLHFIDCNDVKGPLVAGTNCTADVNSGAVFIETVNNNCSRINIDNIDLHMSTADEKAVGIVADDSRFGNITLSTNRNGVGAYAAFYDVALTGNRVKVETMDIRNRGTTQVKPVRIGHPSSSCSDITIGKLSCDNTLTLADFSAAATGNNVVGYNPAEQRRIGTAPSGYFGQVDGTAANYSVIPLGPVSWDTPAAGEVVPRRTELGTNAVAIASGTVFLSYFTAEKTETISTLTAYTGAVAAGATPTLCRLGVYSVAPDGSLTPVASTANDTTLFAAANQEYPVALTSSFLKVAGRRYATALVVVTAAATPTFHGRQMPATGVTNTLVRISPATVGRILTQTDLPGAVAAGSIVGYQAQITIRLS